MNKQIDINDVLAQLKDLVRRTPLPEAERQQQYTNLKAASQVAAEWQRHKQEIERLKTENEQLKEELHHG